MASGIQVGQQWFTRGGAVVRVTCDREDFAVVPAWRWALSNSHICRDDGTVGWDGRPHESDLISLFVPPTQQQVQGMDSTMGQLK